MLRYLHTLKLARDYDFSKQSAVLSGSNKFSFDVFPAFILLQQWMEKNTLQVNLL